MNVIGTGLSGLVGQRIVELLSDHIHFSPLSSSTSIDISDHQSVFEALTKSSADWVFHLAAYTDVQGAEKERSLEKESAAWKINVEATKNIVNICHTTRKRLLYIDTDYAFDGKKTSYDETDDTSPMSWYGITKSEGAKHVLSLGEYGLVIRIANPYKANPVGLPAQVGKKDFVHKMIDRLRAGQDITAPDDQLFVPTFIDDISIAIDVLTEKKANGIYHVVGSEALSPYAVAKEIASQYGFSQDLVKKTTFHEYFLNRAPVPQYAVLSNAKLTAFGVNMRSFKDGLSALKTQEG